MEAPHAANRMRMNTRDRKVYMYNFEEVIRGQSIAYQVHISSRLDNRPIRYSRGDIETALRYDVIGFLMAFGGNEQNITFTGGQTFRNSPAVNYTSVLNSGRRASGISSLVDGRHVRIGVIYDTANREHAETSLRRMLSSYKALR